jgi:hypothetical protein
MPSRRSLSWTSLPLSATRQRYTGRGNSINDIRDPVPLPKELELLQCRGVAVLPYEPRNTRQQASLVRLIDIDLFSAEDTFLRIPEWRHFSAHWGNGQRQTVSVAPSQSLFADLVG